MGINPEPVRIVWSEEPDAPLAYYTPHPPEITLSALLWPLASERERKLVLAHELGHHDTGAVYFWTDDPAHQVDILRLEYRADRAGLQRLIPDSVVRRALANGCSELYEFAEAWGCDEVTAVKRLHVYSPHFAAH